MHGCCCFWMQVRPNKWKDVADGLQINFMNLLPFICGDTMHPIIPLTHPLQSLVGIFFLPLRSFVAKLSQQNSCSCCQQLLKKNNCTRLCLQFFESLDERQALLSASWFFKGVLTICLFMVARKICLTFTQRYTTFIVWTKDFMGLNSVLWITEK